jgi:hypothetical protein
MSRTAIDTLIYLLEQGFDGHKEHALLTNLRDLTHREWATLPPNGERTIMDILAHVGGARIMYDNHAFGDGSLTWDHPLVDPDLFRRPGDVPVDAITAWLREGHEALLASVRALGSDDDLHRPRRAPWGALEETRWIISVMIQHDQYHAGEINHNRALLQQNDRWPWARPE